VTAHLVGVATRDCTPPAGLAMSGFAARTQPATGTHDPITVRALAVDDTVLVTVDACGLHEDFCAAVRAELPGPAVVTATHTHGGPATVPGRLGGPVDPGYLAALHGACAAAAREAIDARQPATVEAGAGPDPGVARNRRRADGPVFAPLTVLRFRRADGGPLASVVSYPCHPVVLGPDNLLWTADYPGVVRAVMEAAEPGSTCLFLTGCCGELNTGHSARDSMAPGGGAMRTFAAAEQAGRRIAVAALAVVTEDASGPPGSTAASGELALPLRTTGAPASWTARVTVLRWGGLRIVALPGEPFSVTAQRTSALLGGKCLVVGYADGSPGYLPPREEYAYGGYEVEEAHRYYGMPGPFAPGAAEALTQLAAELASRARA
jgi:neutral ceramidase